MKRKIVGAGFLLLGILTMGAGILYITSRTMQDKKTLKLPLLLPPREIVQWKSPLNAGNQTDLFFIKQFLKHMDSLRQDSAGRKRYDSICRSRPGLMDSAVQAERYYTLLNRYKW